MTYLSQQDYISIDLISEHQTENATSCLHFPLVLIQLQILDLISSTSFLVSALSPQKICAFLDFQIVQTIHSQRQTIRHLPSLPLIRPLKQSRLTIGQEVSTVSMRTHFTQSIHIEVCITTAHQSICNLNMLLSRCLQTLRSESEFFF